MSEIRFDKLYNQYVIIAPERLHRPNKIYAQKSPSEDSKRCPFCEGNESLTPKEVFALRDNEPNTIGWKTRVVPNLYKAVQIELDNQSRRDGMFETISGLGAHEIVIDSVNHSASFDMLSLSEIKNWLLTIKIRMEDLQKDRRLIYLSVFKNSGFNAGATQPHPHTQLLALPVMPKNELAFLENNLFYYHRHGRGLMEDVVHNEMISQNRIVIQNVDFVAFCPFASAHPFGVMIAPLGSIQTLASCSEKQIESLSNIIQKIFNKLKKQLGNFEYNLSFILPPLNPNFENEHYMATLNSNYRFGIQIMPRIYNTGGFELSTGMHINCVAPEESAKLLRGE